MVNFVSLYLLRKHKQICFIIPYSTCSSFLSSFSLGCNLSLGLFSLRESGGNYPGGDFPRGQLSVGAIVRGELSGGQFSSGAIVLEPSETSKNVCFYFMTFYSHEICIQVQHFFGVVRNTLNIKIKRRSKVQEKNKWCERALNFDQWKAFSKNYEPRRVWLWLCLQIYRELLLLVTFLRVHSNSKEVSSLNKMHMISWKLPVISS